MVSRIPGINIFLQKLTCLIGITIRIVLSHHSTLSAPATSAVSENCLWIFSAFYCEYFSAAAMKCFYSSYGILLKATVFPWTKTDDFFEVFGTGNSNLIML